MSNKRKKSTTDLLVGLAAVFAVFGIGYMVISYGFEQPVIPTRTVKTDTVKFNKKPTTVQFDADSLKDSIRLMP